MTSYHTLVIQFKPVKPILTIRLGQPAAITAEKIHRVLPTAFAEGREVRVAASSVSVAVLLKVGVPAQVHPLVGCHAQTGDLKESIKILD